MFLKVVSMHKIPQKERHLKLWNPKIVSSASKGLSFWLLRKIPSMGWGTGQARIQDSGEGWEAQAQHWEETLGGGTPSWKQQILGSTPLHVTITPWSSTGKTFLQHKFILICIFCTIWRIIWKFRMKRTPLYVYTPHTGNEMRWQIGKSEIQFIPQKKR